MSETYSINVGTSQEANTYTQITDILNLLPDNTNKLINPRDVRDAVFSNWENSIFRYTTNSVGGEYIGISRLTIKDKIFLGKKELLGLSILSNTLLSSDTDLFFYNTKTDTNPSQDLKISFLAGDSDSLFPYAPYIEVVQVSGATPSLSLNISHNQSFGGDFNFIAGNNGRIGLNGLILPSSNEMNLMVSNPTYSSPSDLFLVRTSGGYLEFRNASSISSNVGSTGSITNIYGSQVYVNGYSIEFTDSNPVPIDFGGIVAGSTFSNVPVVEVIRQMLYPYLGPLTNITLPTNIRERNHVSGTSSTYIYTLSKRTSDILSSSVRIDSDASTIFTSVGPVISGSGFITNNYSDVYTFSNVYIQSNVTGNFTFSVSATDGTQSYTSSTSLKFVYPYFYGFSATTSNTQTIINNDLTKLVDEFSDEVLSISGSGYLYYCYPNTYGSLSTIYDGNGFLLWQSGTSSSSWTYSVVSGINSPSGIWSGVSYRVYRTVNPVSIPLPSQDYQFNFTP